MNSFENDFNNEFNDYQVEVVTFGSPDKPGGSFLLI